jgi:hypothetical protein
MEAEMKMTETKTNGTYSVYQKQTNSDGDILVMVSNR